jgi:hypothetical protein
VQIPQPLIDAGLKFWKSLNWNKLLQLFVLMLLAGSAMAFWENRPVIYTALSVGRFTEALIPLPLSEHTQDMIKTVVDRSPNIIAVQVVQTDFRLNIRHGKHFYSDAPELHEDYNRYQLTKVSESPLFIVGDAVNNDRIINIMEQEFVCVDVPERVQKLVPITKKYAKQLCSISVPPRYGKMVGWVSLWLTEPLQRDQLAEYKQIARSISDEVYDRDVMKTLK